MNNNGSTALHQAAMQGKDAVATQLVNVNANVNAMNNDGYTPLHLAAYNGHAIVADLPLGAGATPKAADKTATPRHSTQSSKATASWQSVFAKQSPALPLRKCLGWCGCLRAPAPRQQPPKGGCAACCFCGDFILLSPWCVSVLFNGFGVRQR